MSVGTSSDLLLGLSSLEDPRYRVISYYLRGASYQQPSSFFLWEARPRGDPLL